MKDLVFTAGNHPDSSDVPYIDGIIREFRLCPGLQEVRIVGLSADLQSVLLMVSTETISILTTKKVLSPNGLGRWERDYNRPLSTDVVESFSQRFPIGFELPMFK